ncbi:antibiotic biosynthesis monooxygenase family protein [Azospirillum doebereinerae]|uniref:Antibiotic biosynthesis monooxygenase n=1 Tax=Azospirillum doebereinerae TaxID=92933 RepID=A0A433JB47_9PROT|nr:antibiotic biosynthesis monooxygenase [Azospirillum doebereinerae]MCG5244191.1 antibiotic biosynthesis monooxygenase [Azospirillum doebereinerae]RUQ73700.1 antibiotic biosynthesis monooxygenase [Azospirillum doebereinerae]
MILEAALLTIGKDRQEEFERAMAQATHLIAATPGFRGLELRPCLEDARRYLLLVRWDRLEDHTEGFRGSERYTRWKSLLHHFYDPFPVVEHFAAPAVAVPDPTPDPARTAQA